MSIFVFGAACFAWGSALGLDLAGRTDTFFVLALVAAAIAGAFGGHVLMSRAQ